MIIISGFVPIQMFKFLTTFGRINETLYPKTVDDLGEREL